MSVEKVNKYKEEKKNRKENLEKARKRKLFYRIGGWAAGILVVGGLVIMLGITAKNSYSNYQASKPDYNSESLVISDMTNILSELDEEETESAKETDSSAESGEKSADGTSSGEKEAN